MPFKTRFIDSANGSASRVIPNRLTGDSATPKSFAIGVNCAVAMRPPAAVITNITNITQNVGVPSISRGVYSRVRIVTEPFAGVKRVDAKAALGALRNQLTRKTTAPCAMPNLKNVAS